MKNLTLRHLRATQEIARHGTIVRAANALGLTPSAVTIQLKQIEEDAGIILFDRTNDGIRPTAAGLAFIDAAQMIEERLRQLDDEVDAIKGVRTGTLALGVVSTAKYFAPNMMATFRKSHPGSPFRSRSATGQKSLQSLRTMTSTSP